MNPWIPLLACGIYIICIFGGQYYFQSQSRWNWRFSLTIWNLLLSIFSTIGFVRTAPTMFHLYTTYTLEENFCFDPESNFGSGTTGIWVQLFCLSKFPYVLFFPFFFKRENDWPLDCFLFVFVCRVTGNEKERWNSFSSCCTLVSLSFSCFLTSFFFLVPNKYNHKSELLDTFFIVIHKKPLIFLHWYHHVSVLLYCWHSYVYKAPAGILFVVMNYFVHAIMYFYYFLMAAKIKPKWFHPAVYITTLQITQMIVGVMATILSNYLFFIKQSQNCFLDRSNTIAALIMYGSYLFLFFQFFLGRYSSSSSIIISKKQQPLKDGGQQQQQEEQKQQQESLTQPNGHVVPNKKEN